MNENELKKRIDEQAASLIAEEANKLGLSLKEVQECAELMKDPEYRAEIRRFVKRVLNERRQRENSCTEGS